MTKAPVPGPMAEMNTTPLIDVMLVLLIMFIITIPVATHAVQVDLPRDCPGCPTPDQITNKVAVDAADRVMWNGTPVTLPQLAALLQQTRAFPVEPELQFEPDANASYGASARALNTIDQSGVTKFGFVGNERYRSFARIN